MEQTAISDGKNRSADIFFWSVAILIIFWALGYRGLWTAEERWAQITREMFLSGDFFHPTINGDPYFDKPLLTYWLVALTSFFTGGVNEWAIRVPSAISGIAALWATLVLGGRLWSKDIARTAGWLLLTSYGFLFWSRAGTADMENLAAIMLAVAWYWSRREKPGFATYFVFYLICFTGAHTKGLTSVVVPILAVTPDILRNGRWRVLYSPSHIFAAAAGCAVYLAPFLYASVTRGDYQQSGLYLVFQENILRYFEPFDHKQPFYIYFYNLPALFVPWTPLLLATVWAGPHIWKTQNHASRCFLETAVLIFVFFTCSGSRRSYYILPILPFCALLVSVFLHSEGKERLKKAWMTIQSVLLTAAAGAMVAAAAIFPVAGGKFDFVPPPGLVPWLAATGLAVLALLAFKNKIDGISNKLTGANGKTAIPALSAAILIGGFFCVIQPTLEAYRTERPFGRQAKEATAQIEPENIAFYCKLNVNTLFYMGKTRPVKELLDQESLQAFLEPNDAAKMVITKQKCLEDLSPWLSEKLGRKPDLEEPRFPWKKEDGNRLVAWKIEVPISSIRANSPQLSNQLSRKQRTKLFEPFHSMIKFFRTVRLVLWRGEKLVCPGSAVFHGGAVPRVFERDRLAVKAPLLSPTENRHPQRSSFFRHSPPNRKLRIHELLRISWIPGLRCAAPGMTVASVRSAEKT